MQQQIAEMNVDFSEEATKSTIDKLFPAKFDPHKFISWTDSVTNFLDGIRGESNVPISYVVRPENVDPLAATTDLERAIMLAPHAGPAYVADNNTVYRFLKSVIESILSIVLNFGLTVEKQNSTAC